MRNKLSNLFPAINLVTWSLLGIGLVLWRYGYSENQSDLLILDLKGIYNSDPTALRGDWFTESVPQPHWIYDAIVETAENFGLLSEMKIFGFALTAAALGIGVGLLATPIMGWLGTVLVLLLLQMGPVSLLGSATQAIGWSLPHCWGASLSFLMTALVIRRRYKWAFVCSLIVPVAHAQHGLHAGFFLFMFGCALFFVKILRKEASTGGRAPVAIAVNGLFVMGISVAIAKSGSVAGLSEAYDHICKVYAPFHCYSSLWPGSWWIPALFVVPGVLYYLRAMFFKDGVVERALALALLSIFSAYAVALGVEYMEWEPFAHYVRIVNAWRWISFFSPLACLGYLQLWVDLRGAKSKVPPRNLKAVLLWTIVIMLPGWWIYTWMSNHTGALEAVDATYQIAFSIGSGLAVWLTGFWRLRWSAFVVVGLFAILFYFVRAPYVENPYLEPLGHAIEQLVPAGETIIANPGYMFVRRFARRAVIADYKGVPYDEPYVSEWERRIRSLGGVDYSGQSYNSIPYSQWITTAQHYRARYALVERSESRLADMPSKGMLIGQVAQSNFYIFRLNDVP